MAWPIKPSKTLSTSPWYQALPARMKEVLVGCLFFLDFLSVRFLDPYVLCTMHPNFCWILRCSFLPAWTETRRERWNLLIYIIQPHGTTQGQHTTSPLHCLLPCFTVSQGIGWYLDPGFSDLISQAGIFCSVAMCVFICLSFACCLYILLIFTQLLNNKNIF